MSIQERLHIKNLENKATVLKEELNREIDRCDGYLQEETILELSIELDKLVNEYIEVCK